MNAPATLADTLEVRCARLRAYRAGAYRFRAPPVYSGYWDGEAWCNYVRFDDPTLTGFLPYDAQKQRAAMAAL